MKKSNLTKTGIWSLIPETAATVFKYRIVQPVVRRPLLPRALHYIATHRCNAQCIMCGIWKEKVTPQAELTLEDLERILHDDLFSRLEYVGISGGEPFLRQDLPQVVELFHKHCPRLKRISITTNSLATGRMASTLMKLIAFTHEHGLLLDVSVSCHGLDGTLDAIFGIKNASRKMDRSLELLKTHRDNGQLSFSINSVLLKDNLEEADLLLAWSREQNIPVSFVIGEQRDRFHNNEQDSVFIDIDQKEELLKFLDRMSGNLSLKNLSPLRYRELVRILTGTGERKMPCYYALGGALLGNDGTLYYCSHSRALGNCLEHSAHDIYYAPTNLAYRKEALRERECKRCPPYTLTRWELQAGIFNVLWEIGKEKAKRGPLRDSKFVTDRLRRRNYQA